MFQAKKHRLGDERYVGRLNLAITARLLSPQDGFDCEAVVEACVAVLAKHAGSFACTVPTYCFMPDHLHAIIKGESDHSRPKQVMDEFKLSTAMWFVREKLPYRWQRSYYDHILRGTWDWRNQVGYVLANPIKAGLESHHDRAPFVGSIGYSREDVLEEFMWLSCATIGGRLQPHIDG